MRELRHSPRAALLVSLCLCALAACQESTDFCDQAGVSCTREDTRDAHSLDDGWSPPSPTTHGTPFRHNLTLPGDALQGFSDLVSASGFVSANAPAPSRQSAPEPATTPPDKETDPPAILIGRICDRDGAFLSDVPVRLEGVDNNFQPVILEAWTRHGGFFEFQRVPRGRYDVFEFSVNNQKVSDYYGGPILFDGGHGGLPPVLNFVDSDTKRCLSRVTLNVALVTGNEDEIDNLHINEQLEGLVVTVFDGDRRSQRPGVLPITHLFSGEPLSDRFQVLIIESGDWHTLPELHSSFSDGDRPVPNLDDMGVRSTLNAFVQSGGIIIVTDWAYAWLEWFDPSMIDFVGDDNQPFEVQIGSGDQSVQTLVHDTRLRQHIDKHRVHEPDLEMGHDPRITFAQPGWAVVQHVGPNTRVLIEGLMVSHSGGDTSMASTPLLVEWRPESAMGQPTGAILFASFTVWQGHNEAIMRGLLDHVRQSLSDL